MSDTENLPVPINNNKVTRQGMEPNPNDRILIAPGVLLTVIRLAALAVPGVVRMGSTPGGVNRWLRRTPAERGVQVLIEGDMVSIEVYVVVAADANLWEISRTVQNQVARDVQENVGMRIGTINIHIEDVAFESALE